MDYALTEMVRSMCNILVAADLTSFGRDGKTAEETIRALREKGVTVHTANDVLFREYLLMTFDNYTESSEGSGSKLDYGVEYIIAGKLTDRANLEGVMRRVSRNP